MQGVELLELWQRALAATTRELAAGSPDAAMAVRRISTSIQHATFDHAEMREVHAAATALLAAGDDQMQEDLKVLIRRISDRSIGSLGLAPVLVVEDDAITRRILERALASSGRKVLHASSAGEAAQFLSREKFALVLLDLVLPDADGRTLLIRMRETPAMAETPIFILTGQVGALPRAECMALGADGFFEKPFNPETLAMELKAALQHAESRRQQSYRDSLTQLPNRAMLGELFQTLTAQTRRSGREMALVMMDMDGLKGINDTYGHPIGDRAIAHLAAALRREMRSSDVLCRWGGDEFVALLPEATAADATRVMDKCHAWLAGSPLALSEGRSILVAFSSGVIRIDTGATLEENIAVVDKLLYAAKAAGRERVDPAPAVAPPEGRGVLLAEDDLMIAAIVTHRLKSSDIEVTHTPDGQAAWSTLREKPFALAILDVQMPGMDGIDLLRRIRMEPKLMRMPVIMLTSLGSESDVTRAFDAGASDYITKPFSPVELVKRVHRLIR